MCPMGLYSGPVVCDVIWELLSVLCGSVGATELSGSCKNSLEGGNWILQPQNGGHIWIDICLREEELQGAEIKKHA